MGRGKAYRRSKTETKKVRAKVILRKLGYDEEGWSFRGVTVRLQLSSLSKSTQALQGQELRDSHVEGVSCLARA